VESIPKVAKKRRKATRADRIRRMINEGGHSVGDIARKVGVSRQYVYTTRYHMRRAQGLGAISNEVPAPTRIEPAQDTGIDRPPSLWARIKAWVYK
jgi:transposase-like protein